MYLTKLQRNNNKKKHHEKLANYWITETPKNLFRPLRKLERKINPNQRYYMTEFGALAFHLSHVYV